MEAQTYQSLWKQVEQARQNDLPQTVIKLTEQIRQKALAEKNSPQLLRAYLERESMKQQLTPDSLYSTFAAMEAWVAKEENVVDRSILHALLAADYTSYAEEHRYEISQRTELTETETIPSDIREWTYNLFMGKVVEHAQAALQEPMLLMDTSAEKYVPAVTLQKSSIYYGHDMLHVIVNSILHTYGSMDVQQKDTLKEQLYQRQVALYAERNDKKDAYILATLDYWKWKHEQDKVSDVAALDELIQKYGDRDVCAEVYMEKAEKLRRCKEYAEALRVCEEGLKRYPRYDRIGALRNLKNEIQQPSLAVETSQLYPAGKAQIQVRYKNLKGFTLNLYRTELTEVPDAENPTQLLQKKALKKVVTTHYDLELKPQEGISADNLPYVELHQVVTLPMPDATGVYVMQTVPDAAKGKSSETFVVLTRLRIMWLHVSGNQTEFLVVDNKSGKPVPNAQVKFFQRRKQVAVYNADSEGKMMVEDLASGQSYEYKAVKENDTAMPLQGFYLYGRGGQQNEQTVNSLKLLTDRSIYRPSQTVHVKGIAYQQQDDSAKVREGVTYTLTLRDANHKEIAKQDVQTNDFGSFTTQFVLPSACLNGNFSIASNDGGNTTFKVEEYKRPTFEINLRPVNTAYRLGDQVQLKGTVQALNGVSVQNLPLAYTITRHAMPYFRFNAKTEPQIADTVKIGADGSFVIPVELKGKESGNYKVEVTVTDEAGETQTASWNIHASGTAYHIQGNLSRQLCKEKLQSQIFQVENGQQVEMDVPLSYRLYKLDRFDDNEVGTAETLVKEGTIKANEPTDLSAWKQLPSAAYRLKMVVQGEEKLASEQRTEYVQDFMLFSENDRQLGSFTPLFVYATGNELADNEPAKVMVGTSYQDAYVWMDVFAEGRRVESRLLRLSDKMEPITYIYNKEYGESLQVKFRMLRDGVVYEKDCTWTKRKEQPVVDLKWITFRDHLKPGQQEEWKLVVKTRQGTPAVAELLALMYDASLDKIYKREQWLQLYRGSKQSFVWSRSSSLRNAFMQAEFPLSWVNVPNWALDYLYNPFVFDYIVSSRAVVAYGAKRMGAVAMKVQANGVAMDVDGAEETVAMVAAPQFAEAETVSSEEMAEDKGALEENDNLRTNFAETAFFYPQLRTNEDGEVVISFTVPQSLTRWNVAAYAHTKAMETGLLRGEAITQKEFMLKPNMPRFVRVGDKVQIAASLQNLSGNDVAGQAELTLFNPVNEKVIAREKVSFTVEAGRNASLAFHFDVPEQYDVLGVRVVADGGSFSDGEQHLLPVLSNKQHVVETLAMPIRGEQTRSFSLETLFNHQSKTATQRKLTIEFTGNPAWYAVQALPSLSQPTTDNAIDWAIAYYVNALARHIANSQPRIMSVFNSWKLSPEVSKETLISQLQKNQELKNILLSESPWVMEAESEADQRARISTLFELNEMGNRLTSALTKLQALQESDGGWSWFKGMDSSRYTTTYITSLLVRLSYMVDSNDLSAEVASMRARAFIYLHQEALREYQEISKLERKGVKMAGLSEQAMQYLYLTALGGEKIPPSNKEAHEYFLGKLSEMLATSSMKFKAQAAVILKKNGRNSLADNFIASLKEHLTQEDEQGAHFAFNDRSSYDWGTMPVPVHVSAMEALQLFPGNDSLIEEMKLWLLKQKQTHAWKSSVMSADAIYALLCRGKDLLANDGDVRITIAGEVMETQAPAKTTVPGLGYVKQTFTDSKVLKAKTLKVEKRDAGIAWGAAYAQYLSPIADVGQAGKELSIERKLYVERVAADGKKTLQEVAGGALSVGDVLVSRITIRLDRSMDFVQLKESMAACLEPVESLSGYRWSNGLGFYKELDDAAVNFFFDNLGKGVYVLENRYRIARAGSYTFGLATIQSAYSPEFSSHTSGEAVVVRE